MNTPLSPDDVAPSCGGLTYQQLFEDRFFTRLCWDEPMLGRTLLCENTKTPWCGNVRQSATVNDCINFQRRSTPVGSHHSEYALLHDFIVVHWAQLEEKKGKAPVQTSKIEDIAVVCLSWTVLMAGILGIGYFFFCYLRLMFNR